MAGFALMIRASPAVVVPGNIGGKSDGKVYERSRPDRCRDDDEGFRGFARRYRDVDRFTRWHWIDWWFGGSSGTRDRGCGGACWDGPVDDLQSLALSRAQRLLLVHIRRPLPVGQQDCPLL